MPLCLAARARLLFRGILGAWDGALGAVMTKRGAALGAATRVSSDSEDTRSDDTGSDDARSDDTGSDDARSDDDRSDDARSDDTSDRGGTSTPSRWRKVSNVRQGASPKAHRVVRNTGSKT